MAIQISELMRRSATTACPVVRGVRPDQFSRTTPCTEYDVRALLNHLFQVVVNFQALARKESPDMGTTPDHLTGDWAHRFEVETDKLVAAWSDPAALEGVSAGMGLPQPVVAQMAVLDLTVHSWDLARATGQQHQPDPDVAVALFETFSALAPIARANGVFGEPVPVPDDASAFPRLLGVIGRDPAWSP